MKNLHWPHVVVIVAVVGAVTYLVATGHEVTALLTLGANLLPSVVKAVNGIQKSDGESE